MWLIRLLQRRPDLRGVELDMSEAALATARAAAEDAGVADRARWQLGDAAAEHAAPAEPVDAALCVGSTHVLGCVEATLHTLRERLRPGGSLLLGEGFWEQPPTHAAREDQWLAGYRGLLGFVTLVLRG